MKPKARELVQHGWLEVSEPASVILYVMDVSFTACLFRTVPVALTEAAQLLAE
jgi:hypothetical protein